MCSLNCFRTIKLGFDAELIDYIDHVDDSIVLEKIARSTRMADALRSIPESAFGCMICTLLAQRFPRFGNWNGSLKSLKTKLGETLSACPTLPRTDSHLSKQLSCKSQCRIVLHNSFRSHRLSEMDAKIIYVDFTARFVHSC